jgi:hypothetical protein
MHKTSSTGCNFVSALPVNRDILPAFETDRTSIEVTMKKLLLIGVSALPFLFGGISDAAADQVCAYIQVHNQTRDPLTTHGNLYEGAWEAGPSGWPGVGNLSNPDGSPPSQLPGHSSMAFRNCSTGGFLSSGWAKGSLDIQGVGAFKWWVPNSIDLAAGGYCNSDITLSGGFNPYNLAGGASSQGGQGFLTGGTWTCVYSFGVTLNNNTVGQLHGHAAPVGFENLTWDASAVHPAAHPTLSSALAGYFQASDQSRHVFFVDGSGHIHEMYLSADAVHWVEHDLTATARPPGIASMPGSPLAAYVQSSNNSQHVNFVDGKGHVRELRYDAKYRYWANFDLTLIGCSTVKTAEVGASPIINVALTNPGPGAINPGPTCNPVPPPLPGSAMDAYWQASDDSQHVDFIAKASDGSAHVHELFQSPNQSWLDTDLTYSAHIHDTPLGALLEPAVNPGAIHGYWQGSNNAHHVNFIDANGDVHELSGGGNSWSDDDLTALARSRFHASPTTALTGYWEPTDDSQHVNFVSQDGHVHELFIHPGHPPLDNDLTAKSNELTSTGSLGGVIPDALIGYWEQVDNSQHIYSITIDGHAHHLRWDGSHWADEDLTHLAACTPSVQPAVPGALSAYKSPVDGYEAVTFIGKPLANPAEVDVFQMYAKSSGSQCP